MPFLAASLATVVALTGWRWWVVGVSWRAAIFSIVLVACASIWGALALALASPERRRPWEFALVFVLGSALVSVVLLAVEMTLPTSGWTALLILLLAGGLACFQLKRRRTTVVLFSSSWTGAAAVCLALGAATFWSQQHLFPFEKLPGSLVYRPWIDSFVLAQWVSVFTGSEPAQLLESRELAGTPVAFYHYASFVLPGAFSAFTRTSALATVDAFLIPLGAMLVAFSAYALGAFWWGARGGLLSLAATALLPDASFYGFENPYFSFYWMQQISGSLSWGVAVATIALLLVTAGAAEREPRLLGLGLGVGAISLLFKAHIFLLMAPILVGSLLLCATGVSARSRQVAAAILVSLAALAVCAIAAFDWSFLPTLAVDPSVGRRFLAFAGGAIANTEPQQDWFALLNSSAGPWGLPTRTVILLGASLGVLPVLYAALGALRWHAGSRRPSDLLPLLAILGFCVLALGLAPNLRGNPFELQHRTFVWVYLLVAVWCGGALYTLVMHQLRWSWIWLMLLPLLAVPYALGDEVRGQGITFGKPLIDTVLSRSYVECLEQIRSNSRPGEIVQDSRNDPFAITNALSERPAFLARPALLQKAPARATIVRLRLQALKRLREAKSAEQIAISSSALPIRFYLLHPETRVNWPDEFLTRPTFECGNYKVFELHPPTESRP